MGDLGSIAGWGRSSGEGKGSTLQYSFLPGKFRGRSLVGYSPWSRKESETTERLHFTSHVHRVGDAIQPFHPLSSPSPTALNLSQHQRLSNESVLRIRWPKCWSFSFNISPFNEHPGLISFRMDWLDLLAVQGTLRVFSNTTVQKHQFFGTQPSSQSNSHIRT